MQNHDTQNCTAICIELINYCGILVYLFIITALVKTTMGPVA